MPTSYEWQLRERLVALLEQAAAHVDVAVDAQAMLEDLRKVWIRERRWRNTGPTPVYQHIAGPVIACREYRRSCPGYIVDRRQTCERCGAELVHGRWAIFFEPGDVVSQLGTIKTVSKGDPREIPCSERTP